MNESEAITRKKRIDIRLNSSLLNFDFLTVVIAIIALGVSIKSCNLSKDAINSAERANKISEENNQIANKVIEISKSQFLQVNRPYILLSPKKFNNGLFLKVIQKGKLLDMTLQYEIKNVGNVAAKDISTPDKMIFENKLGHWTIVPYTEASKLTLGPGKDFFVTLTQQVACENENQAKKDYNFLEKKQEITIYFGVEYTNALNETLKYRTSVENRFQNNESKIIRSEMLDLNDDKL